MSKSNNGGGRSAAWVWVAGVAGVLAVALSGGSSVLEKMANAIKEFEGWYPGSRSYRNNNPGNLKFAGQPGAVGADEQGHAIFAEYADGWRALLNQLRIAFTGSSHVYYPTDTLYEFFGKYAEGNSVQYAEFVAARLGVTADTPLQNLGYEGAV